MNAIEQLTKQLEAIAIGLKAVEENAIETNRMLADVQDILTGNGNADRRDGNGDSVVDLTKRVNGRVK